MSMEIKLDAFEVNEVLSYTRRTYGLETRRNGNDGVFFAFQTVSRSLRRHIHGEILFIDGDEMTLLITIAMDAGLDKLGSDLMDCAV